MFYLKLQRIVRKINILLPLVKKHHLKKCNFKNLFVLMGVFDLYNMLNLTRLNAESSTVY